MATRGESGVRGVHGLRPPRRRAARVSSMSGPSVDVFGGVKGLGLAEQGGTAVGSACDVTREADVREAIGTAVEEFGRLDVMFNNAGVATPRPGMLLEDHSDDDWDRLFAINLRGVFYGMKHAVTTFK